MKTSHLQEAYRYCEWVTAHHYENFPVASWLLPREIRPHVAAVYAFARSADDFSDEAKYQGRSLDLLNLWRTALRASCDGGRASTLSSHPIFIALSHTIGQHHLPVQLLDDLLTAFTMDVTKRRYADWEELLTYCRYSANPVGRLVLLLFGIREPELLARSDDICTALQLANHWQDLRIDLERDILYIPQTLLDQHQVTEQELKEEARTGSSFDKPVLSEPFVLRQAQDERRVEGLRMTGEVSLQFQALMGDLVRRARELFDSGEPLIREVKGGLRLELRLTLLGGRSILDRIEAVQYDVLRHRPVLSTGSKLRLLVRVLVPA